MGTYYYELLGDVEFQKLCQALVTELNTKVVSPPTRQRDGGHDAFLIDSNAVKVESYQAKWVTRPKLSQDPVEWVRGIIKDEDKNLRAMAREGTRFWLLMTNLSGTAFPVSGTIDRLNNLLAEEFRKRGMTLHAWWRDDLDRRLDRSEFELKMAFPDMLVGPDAFRAAVLGLYKSADRARLLSVLRDAARVSYKENDEVRFKHGDLDGIPLEDLYVGVEVKGPKASGSALASLQKKTASDRLVIEGAPGQGKSTLLQALGQVYRRALLREGQRTLKQDLATNPAAVFAVRLTDYALWLEGFDPLTPPSRRERRPKNAAKSLEGLVAHITATEAGGQRFTVDDLVEVTSWLPTLFAFDGLDEVGKVELRTRVVEELNKFSQRLAGRGPSGRVIITTRPSFARLQEPSRNTYDYWQLQPLSPALRAEYLQNWARSQRLTAMDREELEEVFSEQTTHAHVLDLATSPMQLALLLSLLHKRGQAIPRGRTELYDLYMSLFLSREGTKSESVRRYPIQLRIVTAFLGWFVHCAVEEGKSDGRYSKSELIRIIRHHLLDLEEDPNIADELFEAATDRLWALTSKETESFQFEVQPIREYFAARHLIDTAPERSSPNSGLDRLGRVRGMLGRPYWLNVLRFAAGGLSRGAGAGLADDVEEEATTASTAIYLRATARTLIVDGVLDESRSALRRLVRFAYDEIALSAVADEDGSEILLPTAEAARTDVAGRLREIAQLDHPCRRVAARLLVKIDRSSETASWWESVLHEREQSGGNVSAWLQLLPDLDSARWPISHFSLLSSSGYSLLAQARLASGAADDMQVAPLLDAVLNGYGGTVVGKSFAADLSALLSIRAVEMRHNDVSAGREVDDAVPIDVGQSLARMRRSPGFGHELATTLIVKKRNSGTTLMWSELANLIERSYGVRWIGLNLIVDAAMGRHRNFGVAYTSSKSNIKDDLGSHLLETLWKRGDDENWWAEQVASPGPYLEHGGVIVAAFACAPLSVLFNLSSGMGLVVARLTPGELDRVIRSLNELVPYVARRFSVDVVSELWDASALLGICAVVFSEERGRVAADSADIAIASKSAEALNVLAAEAWLLWSSRARISHAELAASRLYRESPALGIHRSIVRASISEQDREWVLLKVLEFPPGVIRLATADGQPNPTPLAQVAGVERWFGPIS